MQLKPAPERSEWIAVARAELVRSGRALLARGPLLLQALKRDFGRLLIVPFDLRTCDPTLAGDIYAGYFVFVGKALNVGGHSPFDLAPPSPEWAEELYGFGWLRHLRAADTALARANAQSLAKDYLERGWKRSAARLPHVRARRVISFLSQSPLILESADHALYHRFIRSLHRDIAMLESDAVGAPASVLLPVMTALCYAGLCFEKAETLLKRAGRMLDKELSRQILPDGGHISRNPQMLLDLLLDLLPLRQTYVSRGLEPPAELSRAIERMLPMLRLFRHGDGMLALFNGMGRTDIDHLATILMYDEIRAKAMRSAPHSGYERLEAGDTVLIAETGRTPPIAHSGQAHAGALSFEFSSGIQRIVVNCGAHHGAKMAARSTAAHSTATLDEESSCRFLDIQGKGRFLSALVEKRWGRVIVEGVTRVALDRREEDGALLLNAGHDGWSSRFGIVHRRFWRLEADGRRLDGHDRFGEGRKDSPQAVIRFHLHPDIKAVSEGDHDILLSLPDGETWRFRCESVRPLIEESIFFVSRNPRRNDQIVLSLAVGEQDEVMWSFEKLT